LESSEAVFKPSYRSHFTAGVPGKFVESRRPENSNGWQGGYDRIMTCRLRIYLFAVSAFWGGAAASFAQPDAPSNRQLIAAMPPGVESVLIKRYPALTAADSALKVENLHVWDGLGNRSAEPEAAFNDIVQQLADFKPVVYAEGGSDFTRVADPEGPSGLGNYNSRSIWYVQQPLGPLRRRLDGKALPTQPATASNPHAPRVYETEVKQYVPKDGRAAPVQEKRFIAFPSDYCVVVVEQKGELDDILKALASRSAELPERWRSVAGKLEIESPVVLLRRYNRTNTLDYYSPFNPEFLPVDIESFGLILPSEKRVNFRVRCLSRSVMEAEQYYKRGFLREEEYRWRVTMREGGFDAELVAVNGNTQTVMMLLYVLFGANMFI
jgi:hypothetical protein